MANYIDRQKALDAVHRIIFDFFDICSDDDESPITYNDEKLLEINKAITTQLKALSSYETEVEPVKSGKWIKNENNTWSCSICQSWIPNANHYYARYCLYCGAKMDGDDEDVDKTAK